MTTIREDSTTPDIPSVGANNHEEQDSTTVSTSAVEETDKRGRPFTPEMTELIGDYEHRNSTILSTLPVEATDKQHEQCFSTNTTKPTPESSNQSERQGSAALSTSAVEFVHKTGNCR